MTQITDPQKTNYLGKYKVVSKLGQGAMGMVYKGYDPSIERYVAIKTVSSHILDMDDSTIRSSLERFKQEAKAAGRLNHPNIVSVYEYGEDKNTIFIAMEFVEGRELKDFLKGHEGLDSVSKSVNLMIQLLEALKHSHKNGVIHRDVKPGNIIVKKNGTIKVTDFGIARISSSELTQIGTLMGTPSYMSPEILDDKDVDGRADLFSAGIVFYQCLTGRKPFEGSPQQVMHKITTQVHTPPSKLKPGLSPELDRIIDKALAKNPDQRYQSAEAMLHDLKQVAGQTSTARNNVRPDHYSTPSYGNKQFKPKGEYQKKETDKSSMTPLLISFALLVLVSLIALSLYYNRFISTPAPPDPKPGPELATIKDPPPKQLPVPKTEPLVISSLQEDITALDEALEKYAGWISQTTVRDLLRLKIGFEKNVEADTDLFNTVMNDIMSSGKVSRVSQGPADLIFAREQTNKGPFLKLKSRFLINAPDSVFPADEILNPDKASQVKILPMISKLYAFKTFDLLESLKSTPGIKSNMTFSDTENNMFNIGDITEICIRPNETAYLILLNINSMNITMLFPHIVDQENFLLKGQAKCTGKMKISPPVGTEMIVSFLCTDKELISNFGYTLSETTGFHTWDYNYGQAFDFCESLMFELLNASRENWSTENSIVKIRN